MESNGEIRIWAMMIVRCYEAKDRKYPYYGGRGITVCDRWLASYKHFLEDMGPRPTKDHSLDRVNNDGSYCPENCRWVTKKEQANNRRSNRLITSNGQTKTVSQWSEELGINQTTITQRLNAYGYNETKALDPSDLSNKTLLTFNGETRTVGEWAKHLGLKRSTLSMRLRKYNYSLEKALLSPKGRRTTAELIEHDGRSLTYREWARETGVGENTLRRRIENYGWTVEKAMKTPTITPEKRNPNGRPANRRNAGVTIMIRPHMTCDIDENGTSEATTLH